MGNRAFCGGASFSEMKGLKTVEEATAFFMGFAKVINQIRNLSKFIIAQVQGKVVGGGVGLVAACDYVIAHESAALGIFGPMPDLQQLENPRTNLATQIISSDGTILGKYYFDDNRTPIGFDEIPTDMVEALIATEDERFYDHAGIDWRGTLRAFVFLGKRGGASTITQQLARQIFVGVRSRNVLKTIFQKAQEWVIAVQLEQRYTKKEIMAMYLNKYDFGYQADGIRSAAKIFFNKTPQELSIEESATLVGMLKNSSLFNPIRRPERVKERRNIVFQQMVRNQRITEQEKESLAQLPLKITFTPESHFSG
jgi:penicillin-binding protein 1A